MSISDNIKALRKRYNLSQKELALIAGVTDKAVSSWESGTREPRMGVIQKLADHFGIKKSEIIDDGSAPEKDYASRYPAQFEKVLNAAEVSFNGEVCQLDEEGKALLRNAIRLAFNDAKEKNRRKKK